MSRPVQFAIVSAALVALASVLARIACATKPSAEPTIDVQPRVEAPSKESSPLLDPATRSDERRLPEPVVAADPRPADQDDAQAAMATDSRSAPLLATGRVVDREKNPVQSAIVRVERAPPSSSDSDVVGFATTDRQGRFEVRGASNSTELILSVGRHGYFESTLSIACGTENVEIELRREGFVSGRLLVDSWVPFENLRLRLTTVHAPDHSYSSYGPKIEKDGTFSQPGLSAAKVRLSVELAGDPWDVLVLDDVAVRDPGDPPDPRLEPIDLGGRVERLSVDVVDDKGARRSGARVALHNPENPAINCSRLTVDGHVEFLTRAGPHDVEVELEGFRRAQLVGVYGNQLVRLRNGIPVRITLREGAANLRSSDRIAVALLTESEPRLKVGGMATFEDPQQTTMTVSMPGRFEVAWYLERDGKKEFLATSPVLELDVRDRDDVQDIVLDLPAAVLAGVR